VNKLYRKLSKNNLSTQREFIWTLAKLVMMSMTHVTLDNEALTVYLHDGVMIISSSLRSTDCPLLAQRSSQQHFM